MANALYYGDNLDVLRNDIASDSVYLIYLDPPFNSQASYNLLFKGPSGRGADAQIEAFEDTWHWGEGAERAFSEVLASPHTQAAELLRAMRSFLGENDVMAYLAMMAVRLIELHRVLKPTGSLYLHCDPTASHYLKVLLDSIFGPRFFLSEIIWKRTSSHSSAKRWGPVHDTIFCYAKSADYTWNTVFEHAQERLGYPTQKPVALLERTIQASSNEGDLVLDPFCGCGTTIHAAQKLGRQWIGIDITHLAISLIERRLKDAFPGISFEVHGTPKDLESAVDLAHRDKYQFQWWAVSLVDARPYGGKKKGADTGIDGILFFRSDKDKTEKVLVSVKGGETVGVGMVRELISVVEREKAAVGVLISLALPTRAMEREAAAAGFFESPFERVPKVQIITLAELFQGIRPRIPRIDAAATFRTAARERAETQGQLL